MAAPILLTGVTGGLGAKILHDMLHIHKYPAANIIATSRSEDNRNRFESQGLQFRVADYARPETLHAAFEGVRDLLFMSSSERDTPTRNGEHSNVVKAAKAAGVKMVWYVSLALGGFGNHSKVGFMQAHYETEQMLKHSGLDFISLRAGSYADAFPLFLNWYPSSTAVLMPNIQPPVDEGKAAWTSRDEIGEGMATLLVKGLSSFPSIKPQTESNIILLSGPTAVSPSALLEAINRGLGTNVQMKYLDPEPWIEVQAAVDEGGKGAAWFEARLVWLQGLADGDAEVVDPALETLLGRRPEDGPTTVEELLKAAPNGLYYWHQNHVSPRK
ncbi:hypothetical protein LTR56_011820 [Elasticomyces elasticus]|nr:hypothetical protein LTR56_011820 [Elasticomyces elasticus]KAK3666450.1 hypothetical protein LTR22_002755 [Elasticomyces elasticus]KAK4931270.1 hypothetical protein LTR49_002328 [Elasticomyces elasticus]KAK5767798.1 hypothetical protein LTS12_001950 [Elasticomyces elasticus]